MRYFQVWTKREGSRKKLDITGTVTQLQVQVKSFRHESSMIYINKTFILKK